MLLSVSKITQDVYFAVNQYFVIFLNYLYGIVNAIIYIVCEKRFKNYEILFNFSCKLRNKTYFCVVLRSKWLKYCSKQFFYAAANW